LLGILSGAAAERQTLAGHAMVEPINQEMFYADGRGPELQQLHWGLRGVRLEAIEYYNPDDVYDEASLKHLRFEGFQVVMITPEEVIEYRELGPRLASSRPAAMFDLGRSEWLRSFSQLHLAACRHFQLMFYDDLFDVICERVTCHRGRYAREGAG